ncbi:MAG: hypothetical protein QOJ58_4627, partial [Alphaproteobacteria bacterium]|nr:hypothetical protein [Alphaproteobacteria bacterium]
KFDGTAGFRGVMFAEDAGFDRVTFFRHAEFAWAMFAGAVRFNEAMFAGAAGFGAVKFTALTKFDGARGPEFPSRPFADGMDHPRHATRRRGGRRLAVRGARPGFERAAHRGDR